MAEDELCNLCGHTKIEHLEFEASGQLHHKFSIEGEGIREIPKKKSTAPQVLSVGMPSNGDMMLRLLGVLTRKGLITNDELAEVVTGNAKVADRQSSEDPRADLPTTGTDRGRWANPA